MFRVDASVCKAVATPRCVISHYDGAANREASVTHKPGNTGVGEKKKNKAHQLQACFHLKLADQLQNQRTSGGSIHSM